jgi:hypothetical protein
MILVAGNVAAAREQEFRFKKPDAQSVVLMGEFNGWKGQPMSKGSDGTWKTKVALPAGTHGYKFFVNGTDWILDPDNPKRKTVNGVENSAMEVTEGGSSTPAPTTMATPSPPAAATTPAATGGTLDFNVVADRTRFDFDRSGNNHTITTKEKWGYKVTLENRAFKTIDGAEVQYRQFKLDDTLRAGSQLVGVAGSTTVNGLRTGQKFSFETVPVELERQELRAGWVYTDDAKRKVKDGLAGLWIRVMQGGQVAFEWQQPPDLKNNAKWE